MLPNDIKGEITACKFLLADSDYQVIKTLEGLIGCTSVVEVIDCIKEASQALLDLKAKRQQWRDTINNMEEQLIKQNDTDDGEGLP